MQSVEWSKRIEHGSEVHEFIKIQVQLELEAGIFFSRLRDLDVPEAIERCINDQRPSFGLYAQSWHLTTLAFAEFRRWVEEQGLVCMAARVHASDADAGENDLVLNFLPVPPRD